MDIDKCRVYIVISLIVIPLMGVRGEYPRLVGRSYERNNTWNGCVSFGHDCKNVLRFWECPKSELEDAVQASKRYVRYGNNHIGFSLETVNTNGVAIFSLPINQFGRFRQRECVIAGRRLSSLSVRVLPFMVSNPVSQDDLRCVLVAFFDGDTFVFCVYVNVNDGTISLDFHEAARSGFMLIANESRYPFLSPSECEKQRIVYIRHFARHFDRSQDGGVRHNGSGAVNGRNVEEVNRHDRNADMTADVKVSIEEL